MENPSPKLYYKIKEVAEMIGETASTIRFWESQFYFFLCAEKTNSGSRRYKEKDIEQLRVVRRLLREQKLTIGGAVAQLRDNKRQRVISNTEIVEELKKIREEILTIKKSIKNSFPESDADDDLVL